MKTLLGKLGVWLVKKYTKIDMSVLMKEVLLLVPSPIDIKKVAAEMRTGISNNEIALRCKEIVNDDVFNAIVNANIKSQMEHTFRKDKGASNSTFQFAQMSIYGASRIRTDMAALASMVMTKKQQEKFDKFTVI